MAKLNTSLPKVAPHSFRHHAGRNAEVVLAYALREDYWNCAAKCVRADKALVFDCEIGGQYGIMFASDGEPFESEETINDSLLFNTSNSEDGIRGGGFKAGSLAIEQPKKGVKPEVHVASKTNEDGFSSRRATYTKETTSHLSEISRSKSSLLTENNLKKLLGSEYDQYCTFFFRPVKPRRGASKTWITKNLVDVIGITLDGARRKTELYAIVRGAKRTDGRGGLYPTDSGDNSTDLYVGSKVERFLVTGRSEKLKKIPELKRVNVSTEIETTDSEGNVCNYEMDAELRLHLRFQKGVTDHSDHMFTLNDGELCVDYGSNSRNNVRVKMAEVDGSIRQFARVHETSLCSDASLFKAFSSETGVYVPNKPITDRSKLEELMNIAYPGSNAAATLDRLEIISCMPLVDVVLTVRALNTHADNNFSTDDMDIMFTVESSKVKPLVRETMAQLIKDDDDGTMEFIECFNEYFQAEQDNDFAPLELGAKDTKTITLIARRTSGEYPFNEAGQELNDDNWSTKWVFLENPETESYFIGTPAKYSRGLEITSRECPKDLSEGRKFKFSLDEDVAKDQRDHGCVTFTCSEDGLRYRVNITMESDKPKPEPKPEPDSKPNSKPRLNTGRGICSPYRDQGDIELVGVIVGADIELNTVNKDVASVFKGARKVPGYQNAQVRVYNAINDFARVISAELSKFDLSAVEYKPVFSHLEDSMSDHADFEAYIINCSLRTKMKELADAYTKRYGEFADDSVEDDAAVDKAA